jgi:hypothetical protein
MHGCQYEQDQVRRKSADAGNLGEFSNVCRIDSNGLASKPKSGGFAGRIPLTAV